MNNNEPVVLGKVKKGSAGKPLVVIIVFLFIGSIILFLPTIINYFGDYNIIDLIKNGEIINFFTNHDDFVKKSISSTSNKKEETKEESVLLNSKTTISKDNFTLTNFILTKENIIFDINTTTKINFDEQNYYLILTKNNNAFVNIKLTGTVTTNSKFTFEFNNALQDTVEIKGEIKIIKDNDYPSFTVSSDESGLGSLTCSKDNYKIEYILNNNQLIKIRETYNYTDNGNQTEYLSEFDKYTKLVTEIYNSKGNSTIVENYNGFIFTTDIDLNTYISQNINYNYYSLNTKANKINYEMTAKGYDCK